MATLSVPKMPGLAEPGRGEVGVVVARGDDGGDAGLLELVEDGGPCSPGDGIKIGRVVAQRHVHDPDVELLGVAEHPREGVADGVELRVGVAGGGDAADGDQVGRGRDADLGVGGATVPATCVPWPSGSKASAMLVSGARGGGRGDGVDQATKLFCKSGCAGEHAGVDHRHADAAAVDAGVFRVRRRAVSWVMSAAALEPTEFKRFTRGRRDRRETDGTAAQTT